MSERGSILLVTLLALLIVSSLGVTLLVSTATLDAPSNRRTERTRALYLAQSGLERAIAEVFTLSGDWTEIGFVPVPETSYGHGTYRVEATSLQTDRAVLEIVGKTVSDSLIVTVTLDRDAGGRVLITGWDDPNSWGWAP